MSKLLEARHNSPYPDVYFHSKRKAHNAWNGALAMWGLCLILGGGFSLFSYELSWLPTWLSGLIVFVIWAVVTLMIGVGTEKIVAFGLNISPSAPFSISKAIKGIVVCGILLGISFAGLLLLRTLISLPLLIALQAAFELSAICAGSFFKAIYDFYIELPELKDRITKLDTAIDRIDADFANAEASQGLFVSESAVAVEHFDASFDREMMTLFESIRRPIEVARAFSKHGDLTCSESEADAMWHNRVRYEQFAEAGEKLRCLSFRLARNRCSASEGFLPYYNWTLPQFWLWRLLHVKREQGIDVTDTRSLQIVETKACAGGPVVLAAYLFYDQPPGKTSETFRLGDREISVSTKKRAEGKVSLTISCRSTYLPPVLAAVGFLVAPLLVWLTSKLQSLWGKLTESPFATGSMAAAAIAFAMIVQPGFLRSPAQNLAEFSVRVASHLRGIWPAGSSQKNSPGVDFSAIRQAGPNVQPDDARAATNTSLGDKQSRTLGQSKQAQAFPTTKPNRRVYLATANERLHLSVRVSRPPSAIKPKGVSKSLEQQLPVLFGRFLPVTELDGWKEKLGTQAQGLEVSFPEPVQEGSDLSTRPKLYRGRNLVGQLDPVTIPVSSLASRHRTGTAVNRILAEASEWLRLNDAIITKSIQSLLAGTSK